MNLIKKIKKKYKEKIQRKILSQSINTESSKYINYNFLDNIKFYVINLKERKDRLDECKKNFKNINFERFDAIKPTIDDIKSCPFINISHLTTPDNLSSVIGASGCKMSHFNLLNRSLENDYNYKYICILEDDATFINNFKLILINAIKQIEKHNHNFDILFLNSHLENKNEAEKISKNLLKLNGGLSTTAQIIKYDKLNHIINIINKSHREIDVVYRDMLEQKYCVYPMITYQRPGFSNIVNCHTNNTHFLNNYIY